MSSISREELVRRYAAGERNFSGYKLDGDLSGLDLSGIDLSNTRLDSYYFERIILRGANLQNARLADVCLVCADLTNADLKGAKLLQVQLTGANLTNADLRGVEFIETDLRRANLTGANLAGADLRRGNTLREANLTGANIEDVDFTGVQFENTIMPDARVLTEKRKDVYRLGIVIGETEDGYYADCPDLQGCSTEGGSLEQAQARIVDAIEGYLEGLSPEEKEYFVNRRVVATVVEIEVSS